MLFLGTCLRTDIVACVRFPGNPRSCRANTPARQSAASVPVARTSAGWESSRQTLRSNEAGAALGLAADRGFVHNGCRRVQACEPAAVDEGWWSVPSFVPLIERWDPGLDAEAAFVALSRRPYCLFLDSALRHPTLGRYSVLAADPFDKSTSIRYLLPSHTGIL